MMNFLTNFTNETRNESGDGPVVKVPVGTVMRFPFASHFCIPEFPIGEETREISGIEKRSGNEIHDYDIEQELVIELEELEELVPMLREYEFRPMELGPDLMDYSSTPHLEHYESSPAEMEACVSFTL
jgi:hypothetical protein